jgi:aspartyl-tRNA(Asn)/glutamyl-tRNA(Gln) amidotransferase subunit B
MNMDFEAVIGLEIHAQIASNSKMFCSCSTEAFGAEPNINTCPVCMGFPGQLPVINEDSLKKGITAALALNCEIPSLSKFDRKNYFYPDLPKGFQISQYDQPVAVKGFLDIKLDDLIKRINITRLHLEDDAGKLMHLDNSTLCDYNRSGIPLMEIVSEPDIRSSREAGIYAKELQKILRCCGASSADMEKGMMRFDASVSIRPKGDKKLYSRSEIKNLNSFKSLEAGIDYEIERQIFLWESGNPQIHDITVGWSDDHQKTYFLRDKEGADDYRYFPEPDLPTISIESGYVEELRKSIPEMPAEKYKRYVDELKVSEAEALLLSEDHQLASYFESVCKYSSDAKKSATFVTSILLSFLKRDGISFAELKVSPEILADLINLINANKVSMNLAKSVVFEEMFLSGKSPEAIIFEKGLVVNNDTLAIEEICKSVLADNAKSVDDFKGGKTNAFGFLVGQVMKQSKGQANAKMVNEIIDKLLKSN